MQPATESEKYAQLVACLGMPIEGDVTELGKEPVGGLMGWHELAIVVRHLKEGVGYNMPRLAESLCEHLGCALAQLATATARATKAESRATEAESLASEWREGYRVQKELVEPMQARIAEWEEAFSKQYHELSAAKQRNEGPLELLRAALPYIGDRPESPAEQYKAGGIRTIIEQFLARQATPAPLPSSPAAAPDPAEVMRALFKTVLLNAGLWDWFLNEYGPDYEAAPFSEDGWSFEENAISYRITRLFDDYAEGYNWRFERADSRDEALLNALLGIGLKEVHNSGDEEDGYLRLEMLAAATTTGEVKDGSELVEAGDAASEKPETFAAKQLRHLHATQKGGKNEPA